MKREIRILTADGRATGSSEPAETAEGLIFTPVLPTGERALMRVSAYPKAFGQGYHGTIVDNLSGRTFDVYGKTCSAGECCYCDALAIEKEAVVLPKYFN